MTRSKPQPAPLTVASTQPDTMSLKQAAEYLQLGRDATRALWERGELPGVSLNQKHLVFRRVALDKFLADMEVRQVRERAAAARAMDAANDPAPTGRPRGEKPDLDRYNDGAG